MPRSSTGKRYVAMSAREASMVVVDIAVNAMFSTNSVNIFIIFFGLVPTM
jgi:hypothetical protein